MKRSYSASQFLFQLDDNTPEAGLVRSISGGGIKGEIINEGPGSDLHNIKHVGVIKLDPIELEVGMALSEPFLDWIEASWQKRFSQRNGAIIHSDFSYKERLVQTFYRALITETKFPTLDGSSKEPAYLSISIQPEDGKIEKGDGSVISGVDAPAQKRWLPCNFRFVVDGLDTSHVNKVDGFSVKQKIREVHSGESRLPEIEPIDIEFDNLTIYMGLDHASDFIKWHDDYIVSGEKSTEMEKNGSIEFLDPQLSSTPLFSIDLKKLGIFGLTIEKSQAGADEIKRCKIELYVESMSLQWGG